MIQALRRLWLRFRVRVRKRVPFTCICCESYGTVSVRLSYTPQGPPGEPEEWPDCPRCCSSWHDDTGVRFDG